MKSSTGYQVYIICRVKYMTDHETCLHNSLSSLYLEKLNLRSLKMSRGFMYHHHIRCGYVLRDVAVWDPFCQWQTHHKRV
jgi:hypothetical protein